MSEHRLVNNTLTRKPGGIVAKCTCGWTSEHFTSLSASAAFLNHVEQQQKKDKKCIKTY